MQLDECVTKLYSHVGPKPWNDELTHHPHREGKAIASLHQRASSLLGGRAGGAIAAFAALVGGAAFGFAVNVLLARHLGPSGAGVFFLAVTIVAIGATVARAGIDNAILRLAAIAHRESDAPTLTGLYRRSVALVGALGIATAVLIGLVAPFVPLARDVHQELRATLFIMLIGLAPSALIVVQGEFLKACGLPGIGTFLQITLLPLLTVVGLLVADSFGVTTVQVAALIYTSATIAAAVAAAAAWRAWRTRSQRTYQRPKHIGAVSLLRAGAPFLWVACLNLLMTWTDILVLGAWTDSATVGIYGIASRVATVTAFVLMAASSVTAPQFAALHAQGRQGELTQIAQQSTFWMTIVSLPVSLLFILSPQVVLGLFGADFPAGSTVLQILAAGQLVNVAVGSVGYLMMMTGHEHALRNVTLIAAVSNLVGNLVFVPIIGVTGAAASTAFSVALVNVTAYFYVKRRLGIDTLGYMSISRVRRT